MGERCRTLEGVVRLMASDFWRGRRVFLTGHTGFKGSWLALWLHKLGAEVTGFALAPETKSLFQDAQVAELVHSVIGDVRDRAAVDKAVHDARPEVVLHLAAQSLVRPSYEDPVGTFATNVLGTAHVLDAVRAVDGVLATVVVTSDKCYENREWVWPYRESDPMGGHDPYSASKGCAELVTASFSRSFFSRGGVATARAGNVIGGGDWSRDRLVPDAVRAFLRGEEVVLRNPRSVRPWQHVLEPLAGYLTLAERLALEPTRFAGGWNFGPLDGDIRTVAEVVSILAKSWGPGARWRGEENAAGPHEAKLLRLDTTKARVELGWHGRLQLSAALDWTATWYRDTQRNENARERVLTDVERYEDHEV